MILILENIARGLGLLLFSMVLYVSITLFILGSTFVFREFMKFYFNIDIINYMPEIKIERSKKKKKTILNEANDEEWLKTRGKY